MPEPQRRRQEKGLEPPPPNDQHTEGESQPLSSRVELERGALAGTALCRSEVRQEGIPDGKGS